MRRAFLVCVVVYIALSESITVFHHWVSDDYLRGAIAEPRSMPFVKGISVSDTPDDEKFGNISSGNIFRFEGWLSRKYSFPCCWPFVIVRPLSARCFFGALTLGIGNIFEHFLAARKYRD